MTDVTTALGLAFATTVSALALLIALTLFEKIVAALESHLMMRILCAVKTKACEAPTAETPVSEWTHRRDVAPAAAKAGHNGNGVK